MLNDSTLKGIIKESKELLEQTDTMKLNPVALLRRAYKYADLLEKLINHIEKEQKK